MANQTIKIEWALFHIAFDTDVDYREPYPLSKYLDKETGKISFIYDDDKDAEWEGTDPDENKMEREMVASNPNVFLEIPGLTHGDNHDILQAFLESDWTGNKELKQNAKNCYFGSIGGWLKEMERRDEIDNDTVYSAWQEYHGEFIEKEKEKFLSDNGIKFEWIN